MALVSPGVEVTVTNESAYVTSDPGTVPLILVASAQDKTQGSGTGTAAGTTAANANKVQLMTSQRELATTYGTPTFYKSTSGTMLHGYELNEYGLQAAYSYLGLANRAYVVRANVDLGEMAASATAPSGTPTAGTYWLDLTNTTWGIHEWNAGTQAFTNKVPKLVTKASEHSSHVPVASFGSVGDYAVVTTTTSNAVYYKNRSNTWKLVGDGTATTAAHAGATKDATWASSWATITGTVSSPTVTASNTIVINGQTVTLSDTTLVQTSVDINNVFNGSTAGKTGVESGVVDNKLELYAIGSAASNGSVIDGKITLANGAGTPLADLGITAGTYASPVTQSTSYTSIPAWETSATVSRPTGSTWMKLDKAGTNATDLKFKSYSSTSTTWVDSIIYTYDTIALATAGLGKTDARTIAVGQLIADHDVDEVEALTLKTYRRVSSGATTVTGSDTTPTFVNAETFTINSNTVTLGGTAATDFVAAVSAANITDVSAKVEATGAVSITHAKGGDLVLRDTSGTPLADAGITNALLNVYSLPNNDLIGTNWQELTYEAKTTTPTTNPATGRLWYDSTLVADIMVNDGSTWKGYRTVSADFRGYNLVNTDPKGPIFAASAPTLQSDLTALVNGDLWVDTSDLENYPKISRYQSAAWVAIDNSDQVSGNGISFADARWQTEAGATVSGTGAGTASDIDDMLLDSFLDPDAPNPALSPRGALLFNTRRSGYGVKEYSKDAVTAAKYPTGNARFSSDAVTDYYPDRWVNKPGNKTDGSPYLGRKAQRQVVVAALKSVIDANTDVREEQRQFNIIATPGYPEAISNMATLNTDRKELGGAGTVNAGIVFGGGPTLRSCTETFDGTSWSEVSDLITARNSVGSAGLQNAALAIGGQAPSAVANTEEWNGTSWAEGNDLLTARGASALFGTQTAAVMSLGATPTLQAVTEEYNGTSYPYTERSPFFPAIGSTHKAYEVDEGEIVGTQPTGLGEDDIPSGRYIRFDLKRSRAVVPFDEVASLAPEHRYLTDSAEKFYYELPCTSQYTCGTVTIGTTHTMPNAAEPPTAVVKTGLAGAITRVQGTSVSCDGVSVGVGATGDVPPDDNTTLPSTSGSSSPPSQGATIGNYYTVAANNYIYVNRIYYASVSTTSGTNWVATFATATTTFPCKYNFAQKHIYEASMSVNTDVQFISDSVGDLTDTISFRDPVIDVDTAQAGGSGISDNAFDTYVTADELRATDLPALQSALATFRGLTALTSRTGAGNGGSGLGSLVTFANTTWAAYHTEAGTLSTNCGKRVTEIDTRIGVPTRSGSQSTARGVAPAIYVSAIPTANTTGGLVPYGRAIYNSVNYLLGKDLKMMTQLIQDIQSLASLVDLVKSARNKYEIFNGRAKEYS